ncbi:DNA topoisomerase 2 [Massospora cicadina]|nr:DNA topoisomerase 2 [Massospora cicadina]
MRDTESSSSSNYPNSASDYTHPPKKQKAMTKRISKRAVNSLAPSKLTKAAIPKTDSVITNEVERAKSDADSEAPMAPEGGVGKKKTVEKFYQKRMQLEYILLRPDIYIGSTEMNSQQQLIYDDTMDSLIEEDINLNAADNKIWDPTMSKIKVTINPEQSLISVYNNSSGILVKIHKEEKVYIPELIFGHLLTSSNYDNSEKKMVGERNGYGAKLCNIFSTEFIVETASKESGKKYYQKFTNNMSVIGPPQDYQAWEGGGFQMNHLNADIVGLLKRRVYDMCATVRGVSVSLNDSKLKLNNFKDYIQFYLKSALGPDGKDLTKRLVCR